MVSPMSLVAPHNAYWSHDKCQKASSIEIRVESMPCELRHPD